MAEKKIDIGDGDRIKIERPFHWGVVIIVMAALLIVGGIAYFVLSRSYPSSTGEAPVSPKATARAVLVPQSRNLVNGTITVGAGKHYDIPFSVDTSIMKDVKVVGSFRASGGSGNDIVALVMNDTAYVNWANGHQVNVTYTSGKMTTDNINEAITASGKYHLVFNNSFSSVSSKNVSTAIDLKWSELRNQ